MYKKADEYLRRIV